VYKFHICLGIAPVCCGKQLYRPSPRFADTQRRSDEGHTDVLCKEANMQRVALRPKGVCAEAIRNRQRQAGYTKLRTEVSKAFCGGDRMGAPEIRLILLSVDLLDDTAAALGV